MLIDILNNCTVEDKVVKLPAGQLDRKVYMEVKKALEGIGGKWKGGKISGFVFPHDPTDRLNQIRGGEKVNLKKDFQFFATPDSLADRLVEMAELEDLNRCASILEPSAGTGSIIQAITDKYGIRYCIGACELMPENFSILKSKFRRVLPDLDVICPDFFDIQTHRSPGVWDRVIANPPFTKNQDIDHVLHMWKQLAPGGILVSIMSRHWLTSNNKKEWNFHKWVQDHEGEITLLDQGEFKESGTMVSSLILKLRKGVDHG